MWRRRMRGVAPLKILPIVLNPAKEKNLHLAVIAKLGLFLPFC